ncbi:hypothetical protein CUR178_03528 [Leishmania enriettii]|uniref:Membrane-associated protein n=1 Tax=Leishmania enriettii TaxID=5663 RepID=A0A836H1F0_LEIEN|nr:hypothetical protein CUR178_03528 [Leishmania enriettii]
MSIPFCPGPRGPGRHDLLRICAWALLLCVVFAHGAAPVYDVNSVQIIVENAFESSLRSYQSQACAARGGVLVPDVSDAIHVELLDKIAAAGASSYCGYLGGSTLLSSTGCTSSRATLSCVWHWDQGRYDGAENAYPFYTGNYYPASESGGGLSGAGMISTASGNYWMQENGVQAFPGKKHERYAMLARPQTYSGAGWIDSSDASFSYGSFPTNRYFLMCLVEKTTTTTTEPPTVTTTTTTEPPTVTTTPSTEPPTATTTPSTEPPTATTTPSTEPPTATSTFTPPPDSSADDESMKRVTKRKVNTWIGISIVITLVLSLAFLFIICKARRKRWCCFAGKQSAAAAPIASSALIASAASRSAMPSSSRCSRHSSNSRLSSESSSCCSVRSFHVATVDRAGGGRRSILQDESRGMMDNNEHLDTYSCASSEFSKWREDRLSPAEGVVMLLRPELSHASTGPAVVAPPASDSQTLTRRSFSNSPDEGNTDTPPPRLRRISSVSFIDLGNV